jgi:hypothetical protein
MARRVATFPRDSRTADRNGPVESSPFRSSLPRKRAAGAEAMIATRDKEIDVLEDLLRNATDPKVQQRLTLQYVATVNNRNSWLDYVADGFPKETRAVIVP